MQTPFLFVLLRGHAVKKVVGSISFLKKNGLFTPDAIIKVDTEG